MKAGAGVEEDATGDFFANAGELLETGGGFLERDAGGEVPGPMSRGDGGGDAVDESGAVAESATTQGGFADLSNGFRGGEGGGAEGVAELVVEEADLGDGLEGGAEEADEARPPGVADEAEAGEGLDGVAEVGVVGELGVEMGPVKVEMKVVVKPWGTG